MSEAELSGAEVWSYDYNLRTTNVEANRFYAGLYTWSTGLRGNTCYAYMPGRPHPHPSFDADWRLSGPNILGFVIPSPAGPVPGVGWEGRREGVDDVRYLQLLEARLNAAPADNATAREARAWLTDLRERCASTPFYPVRYNAWGTDYLDPDPDLPPGEYDAMRAAMARFIAALPAAENELNPQPLDWVRLRAKPIEADAFAEASDEACLTALRTGTLKQKRQAAADLLTQCANDPDVEVYDLALKALEKIEER